MVSHDREFINNVATSVLAFEGNEALQLYAGGYDDYMSQRKDRDLLLSQYRKRLQRQ